MNKLNKFLDENNISCLFSDYTSLDHIQNEEDYNVQDKLQCLRGSINEFQRLQQKHSSISIYEDEKINDSNTDNCLKYSYPEFFFSLNLLKNIHIEKLIFKKSDDPGNKVSEFF